MNSATTRRSLAELNRLSWNAVVPIHNTHRASQVEFLRGGGSTLFPEEVELLGDMRNRRVLHLMCNAGQDTLSLARLGAVVDGVDFSDEAIAIARDLSAETGIPATFERADVYDWLQSAIASGRRFDRVYCGYGALCWLDDLEAFASNVAAILDSEGSFVCVDFHPFATVFDSEWRLAYPYRTGGEPLELAGVGDYVGESLGGLAPSGFVDGDGDGDGVAGFVNPYPCHLFMWGIGDVVTALARAGLVIRQLHEYPYANGERHFARMRELSGLRMAPPAGIPSLPLTFGIAAGKSVGVRGFSPGDVSRDA